MPDIKSIQDQLVTLGFQLFLPSDVGHENQWYSLAIREFQAYAVMDIVATVKNPAADRWVDRLTRTELTDDDKKRKFAGPIDGVLQPRPAEVY